MDKTPVMFRTYKSGHFKGDVDALFPTIPCDLTYGHVQVYAHVGQHTCGDYNLIMSRTRPSKPKEYKDLKKELESLGYKLKVVKKMSPKMREEYRKEYYAMRNPNMGQIRRRIRDPRSSLCKRSMSGLGLGLESKYSHADYGMDLLLDEHHGIYLPQEFAKRINRKKWKGISKEEYKILLAGPNHPDYWLAWDDVLANAEYRDSAGKWYLYQDGPLFLVHEDFDFEQLY